MIFNKNEYDNQHRIPSKASLILFQETHISGDYLVYTCPYHPRPNSMEQFFNQMKYYIKLDKPNTFTALDGSVKSTIDKIKTNQL